MRQILLTLILSAFPFVTSCTRKAGSDKDTLILGIESEIKNLDIRSSIDMNSAQVISLFTQSLVRVNNQMLAETDLAVAFKVEEGKNYIFQLPTDAQFHDKSIITCEDVLASFKQASSDSSRIKSAFVDVESYSCPDTQTFKIVLKAPEASFLLGDVTAVRILPKKIVESSEAAPPIGSGPYKFVSQDTRDIIFEKFEGFKRFKEGKASNPFKFKKVIIRSVADPTTRWLSLNSGEIDVLVNALSPQKVVEAKNVPSLQVIQKPGNTYQYLGFNLRLPKFQDVRVRKAIAMAINRDEIIEFKLMGLASKANSVLSPLNYFHNNALTETPYDPEGAKKLLKEANAENLKIEIKSSSDRDVASILLVIKEQLEKVGIKVELKPYEFATFFADVQKGNFEMFSLRWVAVSEPDIMHKIFHSSQTPPGRNRIFYSNKEVDKLVDAGAVEMDTEKRKTLYLKAQEIISNDSPYVSLWYPNNVVVATSKLKGYEIDPLGTWLSLFEAHKE